MLKRILFAGAVFMAAATGWGKHDGRYIRDLTMNFETVHLQWASKLDGGKIDALFIVARKGARDVVEAAQRMEIGIDTVNAFNAVELATENMYESAVEGTTKHEKTQELLKKLEHKYQLYVLGNFSFSALPAEAQFKILRQVLNGSGLVFVYPHQNKLKKLFANPVNAEDSIMSLAAESGLPERIRDFKVKELLKTYQFGKGRIAVIDYKASHTAHYNGQALTVPNGYSNRWQAEFENNMVLLLRTMKWAVARTSSVEVSCKELADSPVLKQAARQVALQLNSASAFDGKMELRLRDEFNNVINTQEVVCAFKGHKEQSFTIPELPSGKYYLDVIIRRAGGIDNFGYFAFAVESLVKPELAASEVVNNHGPVKAELKLNKPLNNGSVEVTLTDSPYGRVWFKKSFSLTGKELALNITDYYMPTLAGYLKCAVIQDGKTLAIAEKLLFFPDYNLENYLELAWNSVPGEYLGRIESMQIVDKLGWRAGLSHPTKDGENARYAALLNQRFVPYATRIGLKKGQNGEIKQYSWFFLPKDKTNEQKALGGDESFARQEVKELWADGVKHRVKNLPNYGPAIYTLGDENFFDVNAGYGPSDDKGFRDFVKAKYGAIAKLNQAWGTTYKSFDQVRHFPLKEAKEKKIYAAWFDHRQYMEKMYADMHHFLADEIRKYDPQAKVGAEGSVPGNLEQTIKGLEFWGPYSDLVMDEVLRSIGGDKIRMLWWGGYVGSHGGRGVYPTPLWKDLLIGSVNGSAWYAAMKASSEAVMGSDMDFADYAKRLIPEMLIMQNGMAQLLNTTPLENDGIAILWSHASDSARLLEQKFVNPRDSIGTFIRFCYQNGLNFDFLTESRLAALNKYKVLFLFGASALSDAECAAIMEFVKNGGTVIADLNPGILDGNLTILKNNQLCELFGNITYATSGAPELAPLKLDLEFNHKKLKLQAAKASMIAGQKPFAVKRYGKGSAVLLGFSLASVSTTCSSDASMTGFMLDMLGTLGIKSPVKVSGVNHEETIIRVRQGNGFKLVGLLADKKDVGKTVTVVLPEPAYIYAVGAGYITYGKSVSLKLDKPFKLLSCFIARQAPPEVKLSAASTVPGKPVDLDLSIFKPGTVLFIQLRDPSGNMLMLRKKVLIIDGKMKKYPLHFAFNDKLGAYTLSVTEVASGLHAEVNIKLEN